MIPDLDAHFDRYTEHKPAVPVWNVTGKLGGCWHRFFDTSPISPSGRFLALTRYADEMSMPQPGDDAEVVVFDLTQGEHHVVAKTRGWDTQLGAQVQWGADDSELFFNDMDTNTWTPFGVKMDILSSERKRLDGTVYMVSPDGRKAISPCLLRTGLTQAGYGVLAPLTQVPLNRGAADDDGVYITDACTGASRLLASFRQIVDQTLDGADCQGGDFYGFHLKWNLQGTRIMLVLRWKPHTEGKYLPNVITMRPDGSDMAVAIPDSEWGVKGGHHPNWHPDGERVTMNLRIDGEEMRFVSARADGSDYGAMSTTIVGSGHPAFHPDGRHVVTDAYLHEKLAYGDGSTPIRWADLRTGSVRDIVRIRTRPEYEGDKHERRVDPHPAWSRDFNFVAFNACPAGVRSVCVADLRSCL